LVQGLKGKGPNTGKNADVGIRRKFARSLNQDDDGETPRIRPGNTIRRRPFKEVIIQRGEEKEKNKKRPGLPKRFSKENSTATGKEYAFD